MQTGLLVSSRQTDVWPTPKFEFVLMMRRQADSCLICSVRFLLFSFDYCFSSFSLEDSALPTSSLSFPEVQTWSLTQSPFSSSHQSILGYSGQFGSRPSINGAYSSVCACSLLQPASHGSCLMFSLFFIGPLFGNLGVVLPALFSIEYDPEVLSLGGPLSSLESILGSDHC